MDESDPSYALRKPQIRIRLERILWYVADSAVLSEIDVLPKEFDTPMFWTDEELKELKGTEVVSRIGKLKSEEQYYQIILPLLSAHPELFDITKCGLDAFHIMGSLVLAYSFGRTDSPNDEDEDDEDGSERIDIAMVPLADMLNANPQLNNVSLHTGINNSQARLFQAGTGWEMRTIRRIARDEQIYNTYGNLPNADLLRRYGYVIPGSRDDLVEISAEMIIETVSRLSQDEVNQRVDILDDEDLFEEHDHL
jgi:N-lysine methyltransferase SETD6